MTIRYVVAHRKDPNNVGDIASNPLQYFLRPDEYKTIDVANLGAEPYPENVPLIIGGGGLIGNNFMGDFYREILESSDRLQLEEMFDRSWSLSNPEYKELFDKFHREYKTLLKETIDQVKPVRSPRIIWGAGHNNDNPMQEYHQIKWPKVFSKYTMVGLRDYHSSNRFTWTPCASCMHPAFDKSYTIKNDIIWFEHKKQLVKDFGNHPIPRFVNSGSNIEQTIELLGSANTIITNSYHGAYWGILLGKKVLIAGSWSSKFNFFKHQPATVGRKEDWQDYIDTAPIFPNALDECRAATTGFWQQVQALS
jgi:hypothetical protein